jgi:hypothetical protein
MNIGKRLIVKHKEKIQEGVVEKIYIEDLDIRLDSGELINRKYWEVRVKSYEKKED